MTIEIRDALNQIYQFTYDPLGRVLSTIRAGGTMTYAYDEAGNRTKRTDYEGRVTKYKYDKLNRLEEIDYLTGADNSPIGWAATYTYDEISRLKTAANQHGTVTINYDSRNRVTSETEVFGHTVGYEYELTPAINQRRLKLDGAQYAIYNYDDANRLQNIINSADSSQITFGYDDADRMASKALPNGINTTYEYDGMSRLKRLKDASSSATHFDRQYGYNDANQIQSIAELSITKTFGYDLTDRLKTVTASNNQNEFYNFDDAGNRTGSHRSTSYGYMGFNKLISTDAGSYSYDANGSMTTKFDGKRWRYTWDHENRLRFADSGKERIQYKYDALGRRILRSSKGGKDLTKFIYQGQDVLADDNKGTLTKYINGPGIDNKLRVQTGSDVKYFLTDHLGSTNGMADASGNITESATYDAFGNATGNLSTRYQFTGREFDSATGLHYYRARWYDSKLGRFISEDPIGFAGGDVNLYGYVWNDPVKFADPLGLNGVVAFYNRQGATNADGASEGSLTVLSIGNGGFFGPLVQGQTYNGGIFSGNNECRNQTTCDADQDKGAIPAGNYLIGTPSNPKFVNGQTAYPLYKSRSNTTEGPYDLSYVPITDPLTGKNGMREGGFYLHSGLTSLGCITFKAEQNRGEPNYPSNRFFDKLDNFLRQTPNIQYNERNFKGHLIVF